tara:strand:+ start:518 stop:1066 length:549 start_codon:yes stop_codon:yes gene_type:complete
MTENIEINKLTLFKGDYRYWVFNGETQESYYADERYEDMAKFWEEYNNTGEEDHYMLRVCLRIIHNGEEYCEGSWSTYDECDWGTMGNFNEKSYRKVGAKLSFESVGEGRSKLVEGDIITRPEPIHQRRESIVYHKINKYPWYLQVKKSYIDRYNQIRREAQTIEENLYKLQKNRKPIKRSA